MSALIDLKQPVDALERQFLTMEQAECPVRHIFSPGVYIREVTMPADTFVIGHRQKGPTLNILVRGSGAIINDDGTATEIRAPFIWRAPPGRKLGYCREETVLINVYETDETDVETLEATYLDKSEPFIDHIRLLEAGRKLLTHDRADYQALLAEMGATEEQAKSLSENESDLIPMPSGAYKCKIGRSFISGKGVIATANIEAGEVIAPARIGDKRTPVGRYANHSATPNAQMVVVDGNFWLIALRDIRGCRGGIDGEEITVNYRQAIAANVNEVQSCQE